MKESTEFTFLSFIFYACICILFAASVAGLVLAFMWASDIAVCEEALVLVKA